ncbi:MAG: MdtA/MuxA family multidrug efflux RND transporter periplasmic adaptor subunit [Holophagales bacterium]|jgi:multidrug efflux system membrane fusion protein|nr:MdtA/MuxA family multidrug efflux RND transporter periplasmic adaptor subunit [Holophagales bacterium]
MTSHLSAARLKNPTESHTGKFNMKIILVIQAVVAALVSAVFLACSGNKDKTDPRGARAVPVVAAKAAIGDLPVIITALGTVTPTDIVTVKTRVNGELMRVAFTEGQMVNQGDLLAEIDPRPYQVQLMQAEGQRARNQAAYTNAKADLERYKNLVDQGVISKQQLDAQTAQTHQLEAALKSDDGSIESAKLNLTYCRITAPVSGRVGLRQVDPGNLINTSDPNGIVVITPLAPIHVTFSIPADSISSVINKDYKILNVEAWDRDSTGKLANGKLWAVDNKVDPSTNTVKLKAIFENKDNSLFPNQFVNVRLYVDTLKNVVLVPSAAIQNSPQGNYVYAIKDDSTVEMRLVNVMTSQGDKTAIRRGLDAGETVVTEGIERLRPGAAIAIHNPERQENAENKKPESGQVAGTAPQTSQSAGKTSQSLQGKAR